MTYLQPAEVEEICRLLRERSRTLREEIRDELLRSDEQHHKDLAGAVEDIGDEAVANLIADLGIAIIDRHVRELREVEAALARAAAGTLGVCQECRGEIGYERLSAWPTARYCVRCAQWLERTHVHEDTPTL